MAGKSETEINSTAMQVLKEYGIEPDELAVIQGGSIKTVWKFSCRNRVYCLKRLNQTLDKALFSVNAQVYIKNSGGNIPEIIMDKNDKPIVKYNNQLFVVYEWKNGKDLFFSNPSHLSLAIEGLAKFHVSSKGYIAEAGSRVSTKLGKWPNHYESMKNKFIAWEETAKTQNSPQHVSYLKCVGSVINLADQAITLLEKSMYRELTLETSPAPVLCHQDYGKGNALLTNEGVIVLDLDSVTFDLPSRDLRKIIGKIAETNNCWNRKNIEDILLSYSNINEISEDEKRVLYIDLLFPHWFYGLVKNQYDKPKTIKASEIEKITRLEMSKLPIIMELLKR